MSAHTENQSHDRSTKSQPASDAGNKIRGKIEQFLKHVENAELDILINGWRGPIPPDCLGDNWDSAFESDFKQLEPHLTPVERLQFYRMPLAQDLSSFWARTAIEAWMLFLNPTDHCYGEAGILRSPEYLGIKRRALDEIELLLNESGEAPPDVHRGKKVRGKSAESKPSRESTTSIKAKQTMGNPVVGVINPSSLYTLRAFKQQLGITDATLRAARRAGLRVKYVHKQGYVHGQDWIEYIVNADADNRSFGPTSSDDSAVNRRVKG
ncbi:hypothetical protein SAMN06265222_101665 [Neorhodopirellula lusitana]|uniref:Uncharacterized protein n=1 Tax=Neorhodopirellula lusitana TaxID=445327 RepID=A0ABY1PPY9_9BACT|nr:hypothetical protein [Neorhodopirellula lusitana]SMP41840.1 hypothetical protein SAMN06265222_101665 [Neorhodopirellula lusitana]